MASALKPFRPVGDAEIRVALRVHLREAFPQDRIVDEVAVGVSRADVVVIGERFIGCEIKSWNDTLRKLEQQARDYSQVFDCCILATTVRHMDAGERIVPEWWGLLLVQEDAGDVTFIPHRPMQLNPALSVKRLAMLLWRDELRAILREQNADRGTSSKPKARLVDLVHGCAPLPVVRASIVRTLRDRPEWRDENGRAINRFTELPASVGETEGKTTGGEG